MRLLPLYMGLVWFGVWAGGSYALTGRFTRKPKIEVQRQALPAPAPVPPAVRPEPQAPEPELPEPLPPAEDGPVGSYEAPPPSLPTEPLYQPPPGSEPARRRRMDLVPALTYPAPPPETAPTAPALSPPVPEPDNGMGSCLVCGAATPSWVEVDGRRQGYCSRHLSRVRVTAPVSSPSAAPRGSREAGEGRGSVQCSGTKKDGGRCRRKTRDPSGLCYQHR